MKNLESFAQDVRKFCAAHADAAVIKKYQKYFTEGYDAYGVDGSFLRDQYGIWQAEWTLTKEEIPRMAEILFSGKYEEVVLGIWLLRDLRKDLTKEHFQLLKRLFDTYVSNWALSDVAVSFIMGNLFKYKIIRYTDFKDWRSSSTSWTRRAVPVSFIWVIKNDATVDPVKLFEFIDPIIDDGEKCVRQGLGWFLREAWKKHPETTEKYLLKIKDHAPRLIIQYATERMSKEQKELFRKEK